MTYRFDMQAWVNDFAQDALSNKRMLLDSKRLDAGETMVLSLQLEQLLSETFGVKYPDLKVFDFVPTKAKSAPGAEVVSYPRVELFGKAKKIARYADDLPLISAQAEKDSRMISPWGDAFEISFQDLRAAAMTGSQLESFYARGCRRALEEAMSDWALYGDALAPAGTVTNVYGFLNLDATGAAYITPVTPITGSWASATPEQIIADISLLWAEIPDTTEHVHRPDTLVLPASLWGYVSQSRTYTDMSVKNWCMANLDGLTRIESWGELDLADSAGTGPRAIAFDSKSDAWLEMPMDVTFHTPVERAGSLSYVVKAESRFGGYINPYPLDVAYMDGL